MNSSPPLIDSHCHLNYDYLPKSLDTIIQEGMAAGITTFMNIGTDLEAIPRIQEISTQYENVFHTQGVHPHDASTLSELGLKTLESAAQHPKCRAIGEIGLDYHYSHSPHDIQIYWLERQIDLAVQLKKPIVIHSRDGENDLFSVLKKAAPKLSGCHSPGIIHCFSGTLEFGKACLDLGFYISFSGILTFKKADEIREAAKLFPLDRILVETDSPYLAPIPMRGKKCEPSMVKITAQKLAEVKNLSFETIAEKTTENAKKVFNL